MAARAANALLILNVSAIFLRGGVFRQVYAKHVRNTGRISRAILRIFSSFRFVIIATENSVESEPSLSALRFLFENEPICTHFNAFAQCRKMPWPWVMCNKTLYRTMDSFSAKGRSSWSVLRGRNIVEDKRYKYPPAKVFTKPFSQII